MAKIYTDNQDELTITNVLKHGLRQPSLPKWNVLRLALGRSLRIATPPDESLDRRQSSAGGAEYSLEQVTGEGKENDEDITLVIKAILSEYHDEDLFSDDDIFVRYLQRHVRRGLREFRSGWMESHDFHDFLLNELFGDVKQDVTGSDDDMRNKLLRALVEIGIGAEITAVINGPRLNRFFIKLSDANDYNILLKGLDKLEFILGLGDKGIFALATNEPKVAAIDVPKPASEWNPVLIKGLFDWLPNSPNQWILPVYLGKNVIGESVSFDLAQAPHLLVGGTTGSGKSVCLHSLIISLINGPNASSTKIVLIDPKKVEFSAYAKVPQLLGGILTDVGDIMDALQKLIKEMTERETALAELSARDVDDPKASKLKLGRIVVFVEELADLLTQSSAIEEPLIRLAQRARASGIHLVLATQRPDAKTFSGLLRSNVPSRIALTVQKSAESKIILDENGAEKLLGRGDMLIKILGGNVSRAHGVFIGTDDISHAVNSRPGGKRS